MSGHINVQAGPSRTSSPSLLARNPPPPALDHSSYHITNGLPVAPNGPKTSIEPPSIADSTPARIQDPAAPTQPPLPPFLSRILATHHPPPQPSSPSYGPEAKPTPQSLYLPPPAIPDIEEDLVPPENFALVCPGVYRSGFPKKRNFGFMQTLGLKTILTLVLEDYPDANLKWCQAQDVQFMQFGIPGNKEPFDNIPEDVITSALCAILDKRNHPVLIHCNKGKHRTGCLVGCIRRTQSWSLTSIFDEYRRFSDPKSRAVDQQFIDLFDLEPVWDEILAGRSVRRTSGADASAAANIGTNADAASSTGTQSDASGSGARNLPDWPMMMMTLPRRVRNAALGVQGARGAAAVAKVTIRNGHGRARVEEEMGVVRDGGQVDGGMDGNGIAPSPDGASDIEIGAANSRDGDGEEKSTPPRPLVARVNSADRDRNIGMEGLS